jgi:hypothetical protein
VVAGRWFEDWREAKEALRTGAARGAIYGTDPLRSPVPLSVVTGLEELAAFETVRIYERQRAATLDLPALAP